MTMRTRIIVAVVAVLALAGAGIGGWMIFGSNTPNFEGERGIKIPPDTEFTTVLDSLEASEVITSRSSLELVGSLSGWGDQVKAGYYTFEAGASNYDILDKLRRGLQSYIRVTVPPGTRPDVLSAVAARDMAFEADSFRAALADTALARELDTDTTHLFGYMMPETYFFFWLTPPEDVVRRIKQQFDEFYADNLAEKADAMGLEKAEVANLASIVQWEARLEDEKPTIAEVYLNRLDIGMPLQADPTVQYAVIQAEGQKRRLLYRDYKIEHPYNTYGFRGLPPGPITNPAPSTLRAVVNPDEHKYLYFVAKGDGSHIFSETYRQHLNAASAYRQLMRERRREAREASGR